MKTYKVVAVFWQDHFGGHQSPIPKTPDLSLQPPTLTVGLLIKKTKKAVLIVSDIERYVHGDEGTYVVILRSCIDAIKEFGEIEIDNLQFAT